MKLSEAVAQDMPLELRVPGLGDIPLAWIWELKDGNAPDARGAEVLQSFVTRKAAGEDPAKLEAWTIAEDGGQKRFRYMKAIPTASLCLTCHGSNIDPELRAHLAKLYPNDTAVGYNEGDIRGAFTISQPM